MFDASVFPEPDEFIVSGPDRPANSYLIFGSGLHQCGGQQIAETVLRMVVARLLLLKELRRVAGPTGEVQNMLGLPLPESMVLLFDPHP
jgi:cytochrome P450